MDWTSDRVKALRERFHLTQAEFADALGLSRTASVTDLEKGRSAVTGTLARLLDAIAQHGPSVGRPASSEPAERLEAAAAELQVIAQSIRSASSAE